MGFENYRFPGLAPDLLELSLLEVGVGWGGDGGWAPVFLLKAPLPQTSPREAGLRTFQNGIFTPKESDENCRRCEDRA